MKPDLVARAALVAAASAALLAPLTGCASADPSAQPSTPLSQPPSTRPAPAPSPPAPAPSPSEEPSSSGAAYHDGTYSVQGWYGGAPSYMTITVDLRDGTIADVAVEPMPENNDTSRGYQERFAAAVPEAVVGKRLDEAEVGKLAGASGCADGFNDAIAKIRDQASTTD